MNNPIPPENLIQILIAGFSMGIAGSLHCISMCGPLVAAVFQNQAKGLHYKLIYNSARISIYITLGVIAGILGYALDILAIQRFLSLFLGVTLVALGVFGFRKFYIPPIDKYLGKFTSALKQLFGNFIKRKGFASIIGLGLLNGLLPCGLTYMALAYALTLPDSFAGALFMLAFGLGTFPAMVGIPVVVGTLGPKSTAFLKKLNAFILIAIGALLIYRSYMHFHGAMSGEM